MAEEEIVQVLSGMNSLVAQLGSLGRWIQALGLFVILWVVINLTNWYMNRKKLKLIDTMSEDIKRIEKKVDKLSKK